MNVEYALRLCDNDIDDSIGLPVTKVPDGLNARQWIVARVRLLSERTDITNEAYIPVGKEEYLEEQ